MPISIRTLSVATLFSCSAVVASANSNDLTQAPEGASGSDFIEVFETLSGKHPGIRKGHARGICASGYFVPSEQAAERFGSVLFDQRQPVIARFSMGGGNPLADERSNTPRGVGIQFQGESLHQIAGLSTPLFAGKNPQQFLGLLRLNAKIKAGEATVEDRAAYLKANPEAARQGAWLAENPPSTEYTNGRYFGVHTFFAEGGDGERVKFRWQLEPQQPVESLTPEERKTLPAHFLNQRLTEQLADQQAVFDWYWVMGEEQDTEVDPSQLWPADRERVKVGQVVFDQAGGEACDGINFDPNLVADGVSSSADPVLRLRSTAYAISFGKRLINQ